jgi:hypothetical protein
MKDCPSPRGDNSKREKKITENLKKKICRTNVNKTWDKLSLGKGNFKLYKTRARFFSKGRK